MADAGVAESGFLAVEMVRDASLRVSQAGKEGLAGRTAQFLPSLVLGLKRVGHPSNSVLVLMPGPRAKSIFE